MTTGDLTLLHSCASSRNAEAFGALVRRHSGMVFRAALRVTGNAHDAEDVAQECFLELARNAGSVASSPAGWLHSKATTRSLEVI